MGSEGSLLCSSGRVTPSIPSPSFPSLGDGSKIDGNVEFSWARDGSSGEGPWVNKGGGGESKVSGVMGNGKEKG